MDDRNAVHVVPHPGERWAVVRCEEDRASSIHTTREEAREAGTSLLRADGGGELVTHASNGRMQEIKKIT